MRRRRGNDRQVLTLNPSNQPPKWRFFLCPPKIIYVFYYFSVDMIVMFFINYTHQATKQENTAMKALNAILVALIVTSASTVQANEMPDALQIGSLVCEIFTSEGAYFCVDTTPVKDGQASNTLILEHRDLIAMGAKAKG